jgi:hypothetical protein
MCLHGMVLIYVQGQLYLIYLGKKLAHRAVNGSSNIMKEDNLSKLMKTLKIQVSSIQGVKFFIA